LPITTVVQEQLDQIPLQQEEPLLVQPEDDVPYTLPTILHPEVVLQDPEIDQSLDIRVHHDPVELRMMEVFQQVDSKSFGSHAFMLVTVEIPCSKSQPTTFNQPTPFSYAFTSKYIKATLGHMRFHGWSPWKVDFVDLSRRTDHLAAWLHWSFEYDDLTKTPIHHHTPLIHDDGINQISLLLKDNGSFSMRYKSGIVVSVTLIFEAFKYVAFKAAFDYSTLVVDIAP
jgi:hypothetical protein